MDCNKAQDLMSLSLDHLLSQEEEQTLQLHIDSCESCKADYDLYQLMHQSLTSEEAASLPDDFHKDLMQRVDDEKVIPMKRRFNYRQFNIAAAIVLVIMIGAIGFGNMNGFFSQDLATETMTESSMEMASVEEVQEVEMAIMEEKTEEMVESAEESFDMKEESAEVASEMNEEVTNEDAMETAPMEAAPMEVAFSEVVDEDETLDNMDVNMDAAVTMTTSEDIDEVAEYDTVDDEATVGSPEATLSRETTDNTMQPKMAPDEKVFTVEPNEQSDKGFPFKLVSLIAGIGILIGAIVFGIIKLIK